MPILGATATTYEMVGLLPTGSIVTHPGSDDLNALGYPLLKCDGSLYSTTTYSDLNALIGSGGSPAHPYNGGTSPGSGQFRVPGLMAGSGSANGVSRIPLGANTQGQAGATGGSIDHTHSSGTFQGDSHYHGHSLKMPDHSGHSKSGSLGSHTHAIYYTNERVNNSNDALIWVTITQGYDGSNWYHYTNSVSPAVNGSIDGVVDGEKSISGSPGSSTVTISGSTGSSNPPCSVTNYWIKF